jgi:hypothetical protein
VRGRVPPAALLVGAAALLSLVAAVAVRDLPPAVVLGVPVVGALALTGIETLIVIVWLTCFGLMPFVDASRTVGSVPIYVLTFVVGCGLMVLAWGMRRIAARPAVRLRMTPVLAVVLVLLLYTFLRLADGRPQDVPSLSAPFLMFPVAAVVGVLWIQHPDALQGVRKVLPFIYVVLLIWCVAYVAGATGHCAGCETLVRANSARQGLLGGASRLFTDGQNTMLAFLLAAVAVSLRRRSWAAILLAGVAAAAVALQASRAQYAGILVGVVVLLWWRFRFSTTRGRIFLVVLAAVALVLLITSPVGQRGLSAFSDLSQRSGNGGYRLGLLSTQAQHFSVFGTSVDISSLNLGINFDLGISNTVIVLGWVGAALQVIVIALAFWAGARTGGMVGMTIAAIAAMLLATRFSLPLIEGGPSAAAYGLVVGLAAALPRRAPPGAG